MEGGLLGKYSATTIIVVGKIKEYNFSAIHKGTLQLFYKCNEIYTTTSSLSGFNDVGCPDDLYLGLYFCVLSRLMTT